MTDQINPHSIRTIAQLESLYGKVGESSIRKEVSFVHPKYRALIEASPFAVLATAGHEGLDASPRGDPPGFVEVQDDKTLLIPERRGNNRVDSLRNIIADPRVALLFLIPGVGETLRVNGTASITTEPGLLERFAMNGKPPQCVIAMAESVRSARTAPAVGTRRKKIRRGALRSAAGHTLLKLGAIKRVPLSARATIERP